MTTDETRRAQIRKEIAYEIDRGGSEPARLLRHLMDLIVDPLLAELSRLSSELAAIDKAVPRRGESPDVPLVERVVQAVVQMQYDDERCRTWEAEAATARAEVTRLSEAQEALRASLEELLAFSGFYAADVNYCWFCEKDVMGKDGPAEPHAATCIGVKASALARLTAAPEAQPQRCSWAENIVRDLVDGVIDLARLRSQARLFIEQWPEAEAQPEGEVKQIQEAWIELMANLAAVRLPRPAVSASAPEVQPEGDRCEGRYPVPQTFAPREDIGATYRCGKPVGHDGRHGLFTEKDANLPRPAVSEGTEP